MIVFISSVRRGLEDERDFLPALNAGLGWWQADPIAGLVIAALAVKEGFEAWEGSD